MLSQYGSDTFHYENNLDVEIGTESRDVLSKIGPILQPEKWDFKHGLKKT